MEMKLPLHTAVCHLRAGTLSLIDGNNQIIALGDTEAMTALADSANQHAALLAVRDAARRLSHNINNPEESTYSVEFMANASSLVDALAAYDAAAKGEGNAGKDGE